MDVTCGIFTLRLDLTWEKSSSSQAEELMGFFLVGHWWDLCGMAATECQIG